jgi:mRNA interferase MazF
MTSKEIKRGEVYWVNLDPTIGTGIQKTCPAVILSNNIQNKVSSRVVVLPVTSNSDKLFPFEAKITLQNKGAKVLADQVRTVDKSRLSEYIACLTKAEIKDVEKAVKITLSLD